MPYWIFGYLLGSLSFGVGFIASENLILTCAHVIEQASGSDEIAHFDLPLIASGESFSGRVSFSQTNSH